MFGAACIAAAKRHALDEYPREAVGMVVDGDYHRITNEAAEPDRVVFDEWYALRHGSALRALIHSHPAEIPYPSYHDQVTQMAWRVPWGITVCNEAVAQEPFFWGDGSPRPPYIPNPAKPVGFRWFVDDCYQKIRDAFWQGRGIRLKDFARDWGEWKAHDGKPAFSGYDANFAAGGFVRVTQPEPWDLAVMRLGDIRVPSHAGVLLPGNVILHHLGDPDHPVEPSRVAAREPIGRWLRSVKHGGYWLRYVGPIS